MAAAHAKTLLSVLFYRSHHVESCLLPLTKAPQMLANISCSCLTIWSFTCRPITWNYVNVWKLWDNEVMGKIVKYWLFKCMNHFIFSWRQIVLKCYGLFWQVEESNIYYIDNELSVLGGTDYNSQTLWAFWKQYPSLMSLVRNSCQTAHPCPL